jgi:short subunit dehydrogenase-like uncharacterized protein
VGDPYSLSPDRAAEPDLGDERDSVLPAHDPLLGRWTGPVRHGRREHSGRAAQQRPVGWSYGRGFRYREVMGFGTSPLAPVLATGMSIGLAAGMAGMAFGPTRAVLDRLLPAPGQGPGEAARRNGYFRIEVVTRTTTGARYTTTFAAKGDPGYAATAVMQGESALCLASTGTGCRRRPAC